MLQVPRVGAVAVIGAYLLLGCSAGAPSLTGTLAPSALSSVPASDAPSTPAAPTGANGEGRTIRVGTGSLGISSMVAEAAGALLADQGYTVELTVLDTGLTVDNVQYSIDFFTDAGVLEPGMTAAEAADLSYLAAVLEEIGCRT